MTWLPLSTAIWLLRYLMYEAEPASEATNNAPKIMASLKPISIDL